MKKAEGMSLNVVIVAVILLIVLAVLIFIFTQRMGGFRTGTACDPVKCMVTTDGCSLYPDSTPVRMSCQMSDGTAGNYCCIGGND